MLFVTCTPGLEPALAEELRELGFEGKELTGGFQTRGDARRVARLSRIASAVREGSRELYGDLYRRGYREEIGRAPMRETLAAGMLRLAGYRGEEPLLDPMCGSGTLLIEAALIAQGVPPGDLQSGPTRPAAFPVMGSDLNAGALGITRRNARRAGVNVTLERADARTLKAPAGPVGVLVANLPYGKRVATGDLPTVVRAWSESFRGWRFALLGQRKLPELPVSQSHALSNGGLRCQLWLGRF